MAYPQQPHLDQYQLPRAQQNEIPGAAAANHQHPYPTPVPSARTRFIELLNKHNLPINVFINEQDEISLNDLTNLDHPKFDELCQFLKLNPLQKIRFQKLVNELSDGEEDYNQKKKSIDSYNYNKTIPTSKNESLIIQQLDDEHNKMQHISSLAEFMISRTNDSCSMCQEQINKIFEQQRQSILLTLQQKKHELQQRVNEFRTNHITFIRSQFKDIEQYQAQITQTRNLCSKILESQPYGEERESTIAEIIGQILTEKGTFRNPTEMHRYLDELSKEVRVTPNARKMREYIEQMVIVATTVTEDVKSKMSPIHQICAQQQHYSQQIEQSPQHSAAAYLNGESSPYDPHSVASAPVTPQAPLLPAGSNSMHALKNHVSADMVEEINDDNNHHLHDLNLHHHSFSNPPPNDKMKSMSYSGLHSLPQSPQSSFSQLQPVHHHSNGHNVNANSQRTQPPTMHHVNNTHIQPNVSSHSSPHAPPAKFARQVRETKRGSYQGVHFQDDYQNPFTQSQPQQIRNRPHSFAHSTSDQSYVPTFTATSNGNISMPGINMNGYNDFAPRPWDSQPIYSQQPQPPSVNVPHWTGNANANANGTGNYYHIPQGNNAVHVQYGQNNNNNNGNDPQRNSVPHALPQSESGQDDDANISAFLSDHKSHDDSDSEEMFKPVSPTPTPNGDVRLSSTAKVPNKPDMHIAPLNSGMNINMTDPNLLGVDPFEMLQDLNKKEQTALNFEQNRSRKASNHSQIGSSPAVSRSRASSQYSAKWAIYAVGHNMSYEFGIDHNNNLSFFEQMDWSIDDTRATLEPSAFDLMSTADEDEHDEEDEKKDILVGTTANGGALIYHRKIFNDCLSHIRTGPGWHMYLFGGGGLYVSGSNASGCFSIGKDKKGTFIQTLTQHSYFQQHGVNLRYLSSGCSGHHSFVIDHNDTLYAMGEGSHYQLAIDDEELAKKKQNHLPVKVTYFDRLRIGISHISCGKKFTLFVSETGDTYSCGTNLFGALGFGDEIQILKQPKLIERLKSAKAKDVCCGENHSVILDTAGRIWSFGINNLGQLGRNTKNNMDYPGFVHITSRKMSFGASHTRVYKISSGDNHVAVISETGKCFVWGANDRGQCGDGTTKVRYKPKQLQLRKGEQIKDIKCGGNHTVVITKQRKVWLFGCNEYHQCQQQPQQQAGDHKKSKKNANRNKNYLSAPTLLTVESNPDIDQQIKRVFAGAKSTFICVDTAMEILRVSV